MCMFILITVAHVCKITEVKVKHRNRNCKLAERSDTKLNVSVNLLKDYVHVLGMSIHPKLYT